MSYQYNGPVITGTYTVAATPAAVNLALGFVPGTVRVICKSGTNIGKSMIWNDQLADGYALKAATNTFETTNGITKIPSNTEGTSAGVTIGLTTGVTEIAGDVIVWEAMRSAKN